MGDLNDTKQAAQLNRELLALYALATEATPGAFEQAAMRQLGRLVGFNGGVWGVGGPCAQEDRLEIREASVIDRPARLVEDFAQLLCEEPVSRAFLRHPDTPVSISTHRFYRTPEHAPIREYLDAYDIGHLMLVGTRTRADGELSWITAYRSVGEPGFTRQDLQSLRSLLPHWALARKVRAIAASSPQTAPETLKIRPQPTTQKVESGTAAGLLTPRQREVLSLLSLGIPYRKIAAELDISIDTVREHVSCIYRRLGVSNKTEAILEARLLADVL